MELLRGGILPLEEVLFFLLTNALVTFGVTLVLAPIIHWALFSFVPLALAHRWRWAVLSAAIGQYLLFRREAYEQIGGHAAVRQHAANDLILGRRVTAQGLRLRLMDGGERTTCRMYHHGG